MTMKRQSYAVTMRQILMILLLAWQHGSYAQGSSPAPHRFADAGSGAPALARIDFESGAFEGVRLSGKHQSIVANPRGEGKVFRAYVPNSHERSEIAFDRFVPGDYQWQGQTRWYAWRIYLPKDFQPSGKHTILAQWHRWQEGMRGGRFSWATGNPNVFAIDRQSGRYHISLSYQADPNTLSRRARTHISHKTPEAVRYQNDLGRWTRWSALVRWSMGEDGLFVLYREGRPVVTYHGPNYLNMPEGPYFKCGIYTGDPWEGDPRTITAYFDDIVVATEAPRPAEKRSSDAEVLVIGDIPYASTSNARQQLDLVLPKRHTGEGPLAVVVLIHGGGFRKGSRAGYLKRAKQFAATGRYAAATIGYRLSGEALWPAQIHDCKAAVRWLRGHAETYQLDPKRFAAGGGSAGGHLAAMLGVSGGVIDMEGNLGDHADRSSRVSVVLDRYGPTELLTMNDSPGKVDHNAPDSPESALIGGPIQDHKARARSASPTTYVTPDDAAFLIIHGREDMSVPVSQSERLHRLLSEAGVASTLEIVPAAGHGLRGIEGLFEPELAFLDRQFWAP